MQDKNIMKSVHTSHWNGIYPYSATHRLDWITILKEQRKWHLTETKRWPEMTLEGRYLSLLKVIDTDRNQTTDCEIIRGLHGSYLLKHPTLSGSRTKWHKYKNTTHLTSNGYLLIYINTTDGGKERCMMKCYSQVGNTFPNLRGIYEFNVLPSPASFWLKYLVKSFQSKLSKKFYNRANDMKLDTFNTRLSSRSPDPL